MLLYLILLLCIIFCLIIISWIWPPNSPWAPWWRTRKNIAKAALKLANISDKDIIYELGSGEGILLITGAKYFGASGVGIEIEPFRLFLSKLSIRRQGLDKKIKIKKGDFLKENLSGATIVYVYLVPKTLNKLIPKFKKELKKGTKIISYKYPMDLPLWREDKKNHLYLYQI